MRGVGANRQVAAPPRTAPFAASAGVGVGAGEFEMTSQSCRHCDGEREAGLEVRLLERRVEPARLGHLEMRVQVGAPVGRVDRTVQTLARVHVRAVSLDPQHVVGRQIVEVHATVDVRRGRVQGLPVQCDRPHSGRDQVDERGRARRRTREVDLVTESNVAPPAVKSRSTAYVSIRSSSPRVRASSRVRLVPGTSGLRHVAGNPRQTLPPRAVGSMQQPGGLCNSRERVTGCCPHPRGDTPERPCAQSSTHSPSSCCLPLLRLVPRDPRRADRPRRRRHQGRRVDARARPRGRDRLPAHRRRALRRRARRVRVHPGAPPAHRRAVRDRAG